MGATVVPGRPRPARRQRRPVRSPRHRSASASGWRRRAATRGLGTDRWEGLLTPAGTGNWTFVIEAWHDRYGTWHHNAEVKIAAGIDVELMLAEGAALLTEASRRRLPPVGRPATLRAAAAGLSDESQAVEQRLAAGFSREVAAVVERQPIRELVTVSEQYPLLVERELAGRGSWYEFFPRSEGAVHDHGDRRMDLRDLPHRREAARRRGRHGLRRHLHAARSTRSASSTARDRTTPSSPDRTIPAPRGPSAPRKAATTPSTRTSAPSRTSTHLWRAPASSASRLPSTWRCRPPRTTPGCRANPEWFTTRVDGTIAYAENPPKKYQDIFPLNFDNDPEGLSNEILRIVLLLGQPRRQDFPGGQPAHQARVVLGMADRARSTRSTPRLSSSPRRSPVPP